MGRRLISCMAVALTTATAGAALAPVVAEAQERAADQLRSRVESEGGQAAAEWYRELAADEGRATAADAGVEALVIVAEELQAEGRGDDLLPLGHLGVELYPDDPRLHYLHGEGHRLRGEIREGVQAYQRSLAVREGFGPTESRLTELWGAPEPPPLGDILARVVEEDGNLAARDRFFEMKRDFDQTGAFDFSPSGVAREARRLLEAGRTEDAVVVAELNSAVNRYTSDSYLLAGELRLLGEDPTAAAFVFSGAGQVEGILEGRAAELRDWMTSLHAEQPLPPPSLIETEMDHARAHVLRGEPALATEVLLRILEVEPGHQGAEEGLRFLGEAVPPAPEGTGS